MRFHEPYFPENTALFIIWAEDEFGRRSLAAGTFRAMAAAWEAVQGDCPGGTITLQDGARVLQMRGPVKGG